jgi:hypothetical protein
MMQLMCDGASCRRTYPENGAEDATIFTPADLRKGAKAFGWMHDRACQQDFCQNCAAKRHSAPSISPCPACGGTKAQQSTVCRRCYLAANKTAKRDSGELRQWAEETSRQRTGNKDQGLSPHH